MLRHRRASWSPNDAGSSLLHACRQARPQRKTKQGERQKTKDESARAWLDKDWSGGRVGVGFLETSVYRRNLDVATGQVVGLVTKGRSDGLGLGGPLYSREDEHAPQLILGNQQLPKARPHC